MINDSDIDWYELRVKDFLARISDSAADVLPGAIAAVGMALATAAALLSKCTMDPEEKATLDAAVTQSLELSILDGHAYVQWRNGDSSSKAIEHYPSEIAELAQRVTAIAEAMPPHVLTGSTDIVTAARLAAGCAAAAVAVRDGNKGLL